MRSGCWWRCCWAGSRAAADLVNLSVAARQIRMLANMPTRPVAA